MYISVRDSHTNGFLKWANAHEPKILDNVNVERSEDERRQRSEAYLERAEGDETGPDIAAV